MKKMLKYVFPKEFFENPAFFRALILGILYLGIVIAQLFTFEKYPDVVAGFGLAGGASRAGLVAGLVVLIEVAALPYLLSMYLSARWRRVSAYAVTLTPIVWCAIGIWLNACATADKSNTGLFGATLATPVRWWIVVFALLWFWAATMVVRELPARQQK